MTTANEASRTKRIISLENLGAANYGVLNIRLTGTAPMLQHRFSEKARRMIEDKQQHRASAAKKKAARDPEEDFLQSMHVIGRRPESVEDLEENFAQFVFGVPATSFKQAVVRSCKTADLMPMTDARTALHVKGHELDQELVQLHTPKAPTMHTGMVRVQQTSDVRYRAQFWPWHVDLIVQYHARMMSGEQLVSLFVDAGIGNGVGDWRPAGRSSSGTFGTWEVTRAEIEEPNFK